MAHQRFNRDFAEAWNWVDKDLVQSVRDEAISKANYDIELDIMGCDIDGCMDLKLQKPMLVAGLEDVIKIETNAFTGVDKINGVYFKPSLW